MIYNSLAHWYDMLVKDEEATKRWLEFTQRYIKKGKILELACGSGEITLAMSHSGYKVEASDLSGEMIKAARIKEGAETVHFFEADMRSFHLGKHYDGIVCYCDSINYLVTEEEVNAMMDCVDEHLCSGGWFLFDTHSLDRLEEFSEEYIEEGVLDEVQYQWTIQSDDSFIHHHFTFWFENGHLEQEMHVQRVFDPEWMINNLHSRGYHVEVWTDFDLPGIESGEKIFIAAKKR